MSVYITGSETNFKSVNLLLKFGTQSVGLCVLMLSVVFERYTTLFQERRSVV